MDEKGRLCAACNSPSPGPAKRLYYQHRDFGPFFPILEELRRKSNNFLYNAGRVLVCTGCANHLLRQWSAYEQKWTPLHRRTYTLLSDERKAKKELKTGTTDAKQHSSHEFLSKKNHSSPSKIMQVYHPDVQNDESPDSITNGRYTSSFITETDPNPFRRAVKQVSKQNTRALNDANRISGVFETVLNQQRNDAKEQEEKHNAILPRTKSPLSLQATTSNGDIRLKVREELQENVEVMIRKLAELQHVENMRRYEQELQEAAQRIFRAQDRENDIERMCRNLKKQLQEELMFRDTYRVLRDSEQKVVQSTNAAIQTSESDVRNYEFEAVSPRGPLVNNGLEAMGPFESLNAQKGLESLRPNDPLVTQSVSESMRSDQILTNHNGVGNIAARNSITKGLESVTAAKRAGYEWKGKSKKTHIKGDTYSPNRKPQSPLRTQSETFPRAVVKDTQPQPRTAQNVEAVLRELEQEREWRKKTENAMIRQREMFEELRKGIQGDVQRLIEEQNHRYQELKETLVSFESAKNTRSQTRSQERTERNLTADREDRSKANPSSNWRRNSKNVRHVADDVSDHSDDIITDDDDSDDQDSPPRTPEYYIH